ncbi:MAG: phosphate/phosphite/phosphonate ABC transporter substrate-binding protein [Synechococcaceae cyanobacterium SM2_3_60]|nr:phosphate/phosphite/phosphonate ABC transporter substrate-binding protein [Synechococcaceae cyanobacterium SM2_3_60]
MAEQFCDRDGDLVADVPTDESEWIEPETLIFAYTPVEDPAVYEDVFEEFIAHLADVTGRPVEFFPVDSNAAQLEAMRAGRLHITGFNTGSNPIAVNLVGFRPFAMMASNDGAFGYEMEIIVPVDSEITEVSQLAGRQVAFTEQTSNSGFKAPSVLLETEFDLVAEEDYEPVFSGGHDNSILGVANGDFEVAAIANSVLRRMVARDAVDPAALKTIYTSETFPTTGYGTVYNLHPDIAAKVEEAFFSFDWEGSALLEEFGGSIPPQEQFIPITYQEYWGVIRGIDEAAGVVYALE